MEIVLTASKRFLPRAIRFFTSHSWLDSAEVSHTSLRLGGEDSNWMVESNQHGLVPNFWPRYKDTSNIYTRFEIIGIDEKILTDTVEEMMAKYLYRSYDYLGFIGFMFTVIWYWITKNKKKNIFGRQTNFGCSEFVYRFIKRVEVKIGKVLIRGEYDPETIFPQDILIECRDNTENFKEVTNAAKEN